MKQPQFSVLGGPAAAGAAATDGTTTHDDHGDGALPPLRVAPALLSAPLLRGRLAADSSGPRRRRGTTAAAAPTGATDRDLRSSSRSSSPPSPSHATAAAAEPAAAPTFSPSPPRRAAPPPTPPPSNHYWEHARPLRARATADDEARLYYEVHGLREAKRLGLQRRAGAVPRPPCWSAAGFFAQSSGGAAVDDDDAAGAGSSSGSIGGICGGGGGGGGGAGSGAPQTPADADADADAASAAAADDPVDDDPRPRVLLIMGLACGASAWRWTVPDLVAPAGGGAGPFARGGRRPPPLAAMVVAALDNRGCGSSDAPREAARYSTEIMAADARRVCEDLGWWRPAAASGGGRLARPVHLVGFSMGGMVASKLAASVASAPDPRRHAVASLTVISASGGGVETIPWRSLRGLRTAACIALARSPEAAAEATLGMHFARRTLRAPVPHHQRHQHGGPGREAGEEEAEEEAAEEEKEGALGGVGGGAAAAVTAAAAAAGQPPPPPPPSADIVRRFELLRREYLVRSSSSQPAHGFSGQLRACWRHSLSEDEARAIRRSSFPALVLHGRRDLLAAPSLGERLARRLRCPSVFLEGAHFIVRECAGQVNSLLCAVCAGADGAAGAASAAAAAAGLPRGFARAPLEAQATWHLEPSPVVQAMWSGRVATPVPVRGGGGVVVEGGAREQAASPAGAGVGGKAAAAAAARVTVRAL